MPKLGHIHTHLNLVRRMGQATGVDLSEAMQAGQVTSPEWAEMVTNCRGCACADSCRGWLDQQSLAGRTDRAPDYCENTATFARLARVAAE
ncbi:hypothetical protein SAMN05421762_1384 [Pseudooceanicola nitratireducens]|jgi:hypothetical protein|uniref:DUF6455 domain-containing protein n=1 Tax=Pseudooceanicola nitratireducens TaxID=517719 RepID=A0A1I1K8P3_9RHOB|nr:DUF6455 family protein [Pseudooceanicola nitratireducens]SEJ47732.1 hypothetical protein SAMN05216183_103410 [Pseudooceanicola nitratireducens]SFC57234.1 hypothetical protein SAMN05421762_1384 [Pseudooceanicola nitratireducens]